MISINSNSTDTISSIKMYVLIVVFLVLGITVFMSSVMSFQGNNGCESYLSLMEEYELTVLSCPQYYFRKHVIPSAIMSSPFFFVLLILFFKEKKKGYQFTKPKQEKISFWLLITTVILFLLSFLIIKSIHCEDFGCLGLAPLIAASIAIFPPLIFGFSLWFIKVRYQWRGIKFLVVVVSLIILLLFAYSQTPFL